MTDFGLAKDSQASNLTRPGQALGSLDYMAPEQIRGEDVSAATDIYALGCMIHECLTGHAAVRRAPEHARAVRPPAGGAAGPLGGAADITPAAAKAINRALEKEPEDRPATAAGYIAVDRHAPPGI